MPRFFLACAVVAFGSLPASASDRSDRGIRSDETNVSLTQLKKDAKVGELPEVQEPSGSAFDDRYWVVVKAASRDERTRISSLGMAIEEIRADRVAGIADSGSLQRLKEAGFVISYQITLAEYHKKFIRDFPPQDKAYHDYGRMLAKLQGLAKADPKLVSLFSIGKSVQGRDIWAVRFNTTQSGTQPSAKPGAVFVGNHHGREHLSVEVPLLLAVYLAEHRGDAGVRKLLETRDIFVVPMLNPDGAEYDISTGQYKWQRKNMRVNADKSIGVDLNRNYDFLFGGPGSSGNPRAETYHGPSAFSEPESKAFKAFLEARPNIKTFNSFHSYAETIMYPWGGKDTPIDDARDLEAYKAMAESMAKMTGYTAEQSSDMYVATGDCTDWSYAALKIFSFTTELTGGSGGFYPGPGVIEKTAQDNIQAALYLIDLADDPYRAAGGKM